MFDSKSPSPQMQLDRTSEIVQSRQAIRGLLLRVRQFQAIANLAGQISAERRELASLADWQLVDIGLHPEAVHRENSRHYWDIPANRRDRIFVEQRRG